MSSSRERLRAVFEDVPELYDRVRPSYPALVFDDLIELARLPHGARLLEIGPGTGQATIVLAERDYEVVCVELGERLAALARRNLARFRNVEVVNTDFETWEPDMDRFDAILAFSAFHWIDPVVRYEKSAYLLREEGALAVVGTKHVLPAGGDPFWLEVQEDYAAVGEAGPPPPQPSEVNDISEEIDASGRFGPVAVRRHVWEVAYSADEYIEVLETYSGHRAMSAERREALYGRIRRRIEARPDRAVLKTYLGILHVARRLP